MFSFSIQSEHTAECLQVKYEWIIASYYSSNLTARQSHRAPHHVIHSGHFYSAPSSLLLLRGAPDYSTDTVSEFHAEAHRQLQVKVPTWRLERESNPRPSG